MRNIYVHACCWLRHGEFRLINQDKRDGRMVLQSCICSQREVMMDRLISVTTKADTHICLEEMSSVCFSQDPFLELR